jgi:hypothetical protein
MAGYQRKSIQILGGGFNCLPPADKVPVTDYLLAQNWRVDRQGALVSRFGYSSKFSIAGAGMAHSAAVHGGIDGDYYVGCNSQFGLALTSSLYWNFNPTAIATGFDGNRIGLAAMNGWMYVMNRGNQGRHQAALGATAMQTWNLAPPTTSATAAAASTPSTVTSVTYAYACLGGPVYTHSLTINGTRYTCNDGYIVPWTGVWVGYTALTIALLLCQAAQLDPNCSVQPGATAGQVLITPLVAGAVVAVTGSDGNAAASLSVGAVSTLPNGTYTLYVTFGTADQTMESNPSPVSNPVTAANQTIGLTTVPVSADPRVGLRNIYAIGGTLGQCYLVGTINDNTTTTITLSFTDLSATDAGIVMPTTNDAPPAAAGMIGPLFARLFAWSTVENVNRLFYTDPNLPQYWPGAANPAVGNWVDVGDEGEAIVWCTMHTNLLVIYKEHSIWMLLGDPDTGTLQRVTDEIGISGAFAVTAAGLIDYFAGSGGIKIFDMDRVVDFSGEVLPLFQAGTVNTGPLTPPGSIQPGSAYNAHSIFPYAVALGYAMGKLYVACAETWLGPAGDGLLPGRMDQTKSGRRIITGDSFSYYVLVYHQESRRWFYHRNFVPMMAGPFGFLFDGAVMAALGGWVGQAALGVNADDFRYAPTNDVGAPGIECVYQSHYEDAGSPDLQKVWLEVAIDYEFAGDTATVSVGYDSNSASGAGQMAAVGSITGTARQSAAFALGAGGAGVRAKNISILVDSIASAKLIVHNVYLYYYEEARLAMTAATLPGDLGVGKVKQCKELQLDMDASGGAVSVELSTDLAGSAVTFAPASSIVGGGAAGNSIAPPPLPNNQLEVRRTLTAAAGGGRALMKYPFPQTDGYLWRLALRALAGPFRLYSARLLMRVVGVYVEAYESAAGFVWDSMELTFETAITKIPRTFAIALAAIPIKRFRAVSLEIETFGQNVTLSFLTDLPNNAQAVRASTVVNTGQAGRRFVRVPLAGLTNSLVIGRLCRILLSGSSKFILYELAVELLPVGVYIEEYEAAANAVFDSREQDFGSTKVKEARELELDMEVDGPGPVTASLYSDLPALTMGSPAAFTAEIAATGRRQTVRLPLTVLGNTPFAETFLDFRLLQLILSGAGAFMLYGARVKIREYGCYLTPDEAAGGALWDSTPLDLGTQRVKAVKRLEIDLRTPAGAVTVGVLTSQSGGMAVEYIFTVNTAGARKTVNVPLPPGVRGQLLQVQIAGAPVALYAVRAWVRPLNEPDAKWAWADLPVEPTKPEWTWSAIPVDPTPPGAAASPAQWIWGKVLPVEDTPDTWTWIDVPFEVSG